MFATDLTKKRLRIAKAGLSAFAFILVFRLFMVQIVDADFYRALASEQHEIYKALFPERGEILIQESKSGGLTPLATNQDLYLIYADPRLIEDPEAAARKLAPFLKTEDSGADDEAAADGAAERAAARKEAEEADYAELMARLSKQDDPYEPLKHGVEESVVEKIKDLQIAGIESTRESVRFYPLGSIGAHLAGFVGAEGDIKKGRYGIEGAFESELAGKQGFFAGERDSAGRWIPVGKRDLTPAQDGAAVVLTIDRAIEYAACTKLNEAVERHGATGGSVVIADVKTGAILAMCGAPDFNPNEYFEVEDISVYNNPAIFAQYEPGSVFKVITMAAALDAGEVAPDTTYEDTGEVRIGPHAIRNSDDKAHGVQTMTQVLEQSLNTGAIFAARKAGMEKFRDYVARFGFGAPSGVEAQGEARGDISALDGGGEIYLATASFGQGISVTPMQMLQAVGAIANGGKLMKPFIVSEIRKSNGVALRTSPEVVREVVSARAATLLSGMMVSVVERGHGKRAAVSGYYVAGKTGTAQIPRKDARGYEPDATVGTFVGFAPVEDPKFVMIVRIDRPQDVRFAESSAAPLFGEIAKFLLAYFEVKPTRAVDPAP